MDAIAIPFNCGSNEPVTNATIGILEIDYLRAYYCYFHGSPIIPMLLLCTWLVMLFYLLGSTADGYFSPTLACISDKLKIPYDIAGVTFLACGNGAPDVFSSIAAYSSGAGTTGINALLGGSIFVSTVVVGVVALSSTIQVQSQPFKRDVIAFYLTLALLIIVAYSGYVSPGSTLAEYRIVIIFPIMYTLYLGCVVIGEWYMRYKLSQDVLKEYVDPDEIEGSYLSPSSGKVRNGGISAFWLQSPQSLQTEINVSTNVDRSESHRISRGNRAISADSITSSSSITSPLSSPKVITFRSNIYDAYFQGNSSGVNNQDLKEPFLSGKTELMYDDSENDELDENISVHQSLLSGDLRRGLFSNRGSILESAYMSHLRWRWRVTRQLESNKNHSALRRWTMRLLKLPILISVLLRQLTIPLLDLESWTRLVAISSPMTAPVLLLFITGLLHSKQHIFLDVFFWKIDLGYIPTIHVVLIVGGVISTFVSFTVHRSHPPASQAYCFFFLLLAFSSCVCWIYAIATELLAVVITLGMVLNIHQGLLGLTIISWGNSVGDLITNVSVAKAGFPEMAIAGCFAGPVFNILIGLGIPSMYALINGKPIPIQLDKYSCVTIGFLGFMLPLTYVVFHLYSHSCPAWYGKILLLMYTLYTIVNIAMLYSG